MKNENLELMRLFKTGLNRNICHLWENRPPQPKVADIVINSKQGKHAYI